MRRFRDVGDARFGSVDSIGSATFAIFEVAAAQALFGKEGGFDSISVIGERGVEAEQLVKEIEPLLPPEAQAQTAAQQAEADAEETSEGLGFVQTFLLAFGGVALFVGAFVIFNTLSITVAQRAREFATMRTLGASRRQVLASVVLEALAIGLVASVLGLFLGLALAKGLNALFVSVGIELPQTGTVFATRTIVVSLLVGVLVTVAAGVLPAIRATRVPPIAAVREGAVLPGSRLAPYAPYIALVTMAAGVVLLVYGMFAPGVEAMQRLAAMGLGCLILFAGVGLLSARLARPLASVLGAPAGAVAGAPGELARENSMRNPGRTAATAAALMIGLALVTFVAVLGKGLRVSIEEAIERQVQADYVVTAQDDFSPVAAGAGHAVANAPDVQLVSRVGQDLGRVEREDETQVSGVDPALPRLFEIDWEEGSDALIRDLGPRGAIIEKSLVDEHGLGVGDTFILETPEGSKLGLLVQGIYERREFSVWIGKVVISRETFDAAFPRSGDVFTFVDVGGEVTPAATRELERAVAAFPDAKVQTKAEFSDNQARGIDMLLNLLYVLLALSVVVSLFGMVNTLVLSVFERTRELGLLRAVGMTRRQARRMVRHESVITALIGGALGIPLGIFLAALVTSALRDEGVVFSLPAGSLVVFALIAVVAGILAAILPARRAARLNVLEALQYE